VYIQYIPDTQIIHPWWNGEATAGFHTTAFSCPSLAETAVHCDRCERATWYSHLIHKRQLKTTTTTTTTTTQFNDNNNNLNDDNQQYLSAPKMK